MAKTLYLNSVAGVAGDMFAAAFVDAGLVTLEELNSLVTQIGLEGIEIQTESVLRASVRATKLEVKIVGDGWKSRFPGSHGHSHHDHSSNLALATAPEHWHVHYPAVDRLIAESELEDSVKTVAREIFAMIADAEAGVHGVERAKAAFHEVGTVDSVMDVVMAAYCIAKVSADAVVASPIKPGRGTITIAHGTHPVPPPASARLLVGMETAATPPAITRENVELSTPTGIAIVKHLTPQFVRELPAGKLLATGRGSGAMDFGDYPNVFQISLVETGEPSTDLPYLTDRVIEIAANIDDDTAEHIAWIAERLLANGALDVWQTHATGKKGRTMVCLSVLVQEDDRDTTADWLLRNSTTFGLRYRTWDRMMLDREFETRDHDGSGVRYKIGLTRAGEKLKEKIEFDDWRESQ